MSSKTIAKKNLKKERVRLHKKLSSLKKAISNFKVERKANWKAFKNAMKDDVSKIKKSIDKLSASKWNKHRKVILPTNGSDNGKVSVSEIESR
ncbi:hypothetical protein BH10BAC4_BH10BAC4_23490 [soil metagenome]